jgi:hypothetical protein
MSGHEQGRGGGADSWRGQLNGAGGFLSSTSRADQESANDDQRRVGILQVNTVEEVDGEQSELIKKKVFTRFFQTNPVPPLFRGMISESDLKIVMEETKYPKRSSFVSHPSKVKTKLPGKLSELVQIESQQWMERLSDTQCMLKIEEALEAGKSFAGAPGRMEKLIYEEGRIPVAGRSITEPISPPPAVGASTSTAAVAGAATPAAAGAAKLAASAMQAAQRTFFGGAGEELHTHSKKRYF